MARSLIILIGVVAGVLIGALTNHIWPGLLLLAAGIALRFHASRDSRKDLSDLAKLVYRRRLHYVWPSLLLAGLAAVSAAWQRPFPQVLPEDAPCRIVAVVTDRSTDTGGERYHVDMVRVQLPDGETVDCRNIEALFLTSGSTVLEPGDIIRFRSVLAPVKRKGLYGIQYMVFDKLRVYDGRLSEGGKEAYHYESSGLTVTGRSHTLFALSWRWREKITILLENSALSQETTQLLRALLTGKRSGINPSHLDGFRDAGVAHALAVSGMHVGIFSGILLWLTLPLNLIRGRKLRFVIAVAGAWAFTLFTGMQLSTVRSTLMLTLAAIAWITGRRRDAFGALCMAGVIILLISPAALWDPGFQLSFSCVAALCLFVEPLNPVDRKCHPWLYSCVAVLLATIVATGATWVISAYHFGSMPLHFLTANVVMLPLLPLLMGAGLLYLLLIMCGHEVSYLEDGINRFTELLHGFIDSFSGKSIAVTPSPATVIMWLSGIVMLGIAIYRYRPTVRTLPGAVPLRINTRTDGRTRLHYPSLICACMMMLTALAYEVLR